MWSIGFGLERVAWLALYRPRITAAVAVRVWKAEPVKVRADD